MAGLLAARLYFVQIVRHDELLEKAREKYTMHRTTIGKRGEIYDIRGNLLVVNTPCVNLVADPAGYESEVRRRRAALFLADELQLSLPEATSKLLGRRKARNPDFTLKRDDGGQILRVPDRNAMIARSLSLERGAELRKKANEQYIYGFCFRRDTAAVPQWADLRMFLGLPAGERPRRTVIGTKWPQPVLESPRGRRSYEPAREDGALVGKNSAAPVRTAGAWCSPRGRTLPVILEEELDAPTPMGLQKAIYAIMADPRTEYSGDAHVRRFDPEDRKMSIRAWRVRCSKTAIEPGSIMKRYRGVGTRSRRDYPRHPVSLRGRSLRLSGKSMTDSHRCGPIPFPKSLNIRATSERENCAGARPVEVEPRCAGSVSRTLRFAPRPETPDFSAQPRPWDGIA